MLELRGVKLASWLRRQLHNRQRLQWVKSILSHSRLFCCSEGVRPTSGWVYRLLQQRKAVAFLKHPSITIASSLSTIRTTDLRAILADSFAEELLREANFVNPTPEDYQAALAILSQFPDQRITLTDSVTAILANQMNLPV